MARLKDCAVKLKAGPDDGLEEGQFEAYAAVFGNKDSYGDVIVPGAFKDTLADWKDSGNNLPLLFGHNMQDPDFNLGHVLEAKEDDRGLLVKAQLDLENPKAQQTYRLLKGRRLNQMSFAYDVLDGGEAQRARSDDGDDVEHYYELRKLKLYEVSVVPIGANQETEILAVKALENLTGAALTEEQKAAILPAYFALGTLLGRGKQDAGAASGSGAPKDTEVSSKASRTPSVAKRLAAEIELLALTGEV